MSDSGWVKLWRKSTDSGLMQNPDLWLFWCWCLLKATHKPKKQMVGFQVVELQPGQFVFGRKKAATELPLSEQTVRTCVKKLETLQNLTIKSTNKFSIITIVNWDAYQEINQQDNQQDNQQVTSSQPAANHKQEVKECKNVKKNFKDSLCPHNEIINLYHETLPELPQVKSWNDASKAKLKTRWREDPERQSLDWWRSFFQEQIRKSDFLMGRVKDFNATLDWIVGPQNFQKILNGQYINKNGSGGKAPMSPKMEHNLRVAQEFINAADDE